MTNLKISNSDVANDYKRTRRISFMFSALRVRGLISRDELAGIATGEQDYAGLIARVRADDEGLAKSVRRGPLLDLAWVVGNQNIFEHDIQDADAIYEFVLRHWGRRGLSHMARVDYAVLKLKLGDSMRAREALRGIPTLLGPISWFYPAAMASIKVQSINEGMNFFTLARKDYMTSVKFLKLDVANPFRGLSEHDALAALDKPETIAWLGKLSDLLFGPKLAPLAFVADPEIGPLESLTAAASGSGATHPATNPKVTIVISAFRPDRHIFTAVKSALAQTYRNLEIIVVDDASGPEFDGILAEVAALDERILVLKQAVNGGTYRIRNRAMDEATGDLITFQDSDDWMHPQRIEVQVKHLLRNPNEVGNTTMSTRLTDRLEAVESQRRLRIGICEPSLMFWRERVRDRIGYFDGVRKGGDTEFRKRMDRAFGVDSAMVMPWRILTIQRADNGGLTQGELGFKWISEFRLNYRDFYLANLKAAAKLAKASKDVAAASATPATSVTPKPGPFFIARDDISRGIDVVAAERKFYAPRASRMISSDARAPRKFDLLIAANLKDPVNAKGVAERVSAARAAGQSVGLAQVNSFYPRQLPRAINAKLLDIINAGDAELVYERDEVTAGSFELMAPSAWLTSYNGFKVAWKLGSKSITPIAAADESWRAEGTDVEGLLAAQLTAAGL